MRKLSWVISMILVFIFAFTGTTQAQSGKSGEQDQGEHTRAMWVWDFNSSLSTEQQRNDLIQFSMQHHINLLFVNTGGVLTEHPKEFTALIRNAHEKDIQIYAL